MGKLDVRIVAAKQLYNQETFGKSDPYCVVSCEGRKYKTTTKSSDLNPEWNEKFTFMLADPNTSQLKIEVFDDNLASDTSMGHYNVSLSGLTKGKVSDEWYIMQGCKSGQLRVRLLAVDFGLEPTPAQCAAPAAAPAAAPVPQQPPVYQQPVFPYAQPPPAAYGYPAQQPQPMYAPPVTAPGPYYPPQPAYPPQVPGQAPFGGPPHYPSDGPSYGVQNPYPPYGAGVGQQPQYPGLGGQPQFPPMNVSQPTV